MSDHFRRDIEQIARSINLSLKEVEEDLKNIEKMAIDDLLLLEAKFCPSGKTLVEVLGEKEYNITKNRLMAMKRIPLEKAKNELISLKQEIESALGYSVI